MKNVLIENINLLPLLHGDPRQLIQKGHLK